jgi:hypothetical protein
LQAGVPSLPSSSSNPPPLSHSFMEGHCAQLPFLASSLPPCLLRASPADALRPAACASPARTRRRAGLSCGGAAARQRAASRGGPGGSTAFPAVAALRGH